MKLALASPRGCICTFKIKVAKTYGGPCNCIFLKDNVEPMPNTLKPPQVK